MDKPLGSFIKSRLFADAPSIEQNRAKSSSENKKALAQVLAMLGQSRLASNLSQLAKAANSSSLPVTPDTEAMLQAAYRDIRLTCSPSSSHS